MGGKKKQSDAKGKKGVGALAKTTSSRAGGKGVPARATTSPKLAAPADVAASDNGESNGENTAPVVLAIKVNFTLVTPDRLRRVVFGLEKDTQGNTVIWKISFQLFERDQKSDPFGDAIADLEIEVDHQLHPQAATAAANGLTPPQTAHATGPAADDAKAGQAGEIDQSDAKQTVQNTLAVT